MTSNVNQWIANRETERSNKARERENTRHNQVTEIETERHNRAMEELGAAELAEKQRANLIAESISERHLGETIRHNFGSEALTATGQQLTHEAAMGNVAVGFANVAELARHNQAAEMELLRHNSAMEQLQGEKQTNDFLLGTEKNSIDARNARVNERTWELNKTKAQWQVTHDTNKLNAEIAYRIGQQGNDTLRTLIGRGGVASLWGGKGSAQPQWSDPSWSW